MKNIVSYEVNDEYCGVVDNKGKIRVLKKQNKEGSFKTYLELENEMDKLINKKNNGLKGLKTVKQKGIILLIATILSFLALFKAPLIGVNAIIGSFSFVTFCGLLSYNVIDLFDKQKKINSLNREIKIAKRETNQFKREISLSNENYYIHEPDLRYELKSSKMVDIIRDSIKSLYMFFCLNYDGGLEDVTMNYFDNEYIESDECEKCFKESSKVVNTSFDVELSKNKKDYKESLSKLLIYKDDEQRKDETKSMSDTDETTKFTLPKKEELEHNLADLLVYESEEEKQKELSLHYHR